LSTVQLVDLATGECAPQNNLFHPRVLSAAGRLPDGRIVCAGGIGAHSLAEMWGPPEQAEPNAAWSWGELPAMSAARYGCCGCVMSDGRFAVLGGQGMGGVGDALSSCEALVNGDNANWEPLSPMYDARRLFACAAVAGCVIVASGGSDGGCLTSTAEVYDESRDRWLRLPCNLPYELESMGSTLL
jgi:hypothetical protein